MPSLAVATFAPSPSSFLVNKDDIKLWLLRLQVKLWHRQSWVIGVIMPHSMQYYYFSWQTHRQTQPVPSYQRSWDIVTGSRQVASILVSYLGKTHTGGPDAMLERETSSAHSCRFFSGNLVKIVRIDFPHYTIIIIIPTIILKLK